MGLVRGGLPPRTGLVGLRAEVGASEDAEHLRERIGQIDRHIGADERTFRDHVDRDLVGLALTDLDLDDVRELHLDGADDAIDLRKGVSLGERIVGGGAGNHQVEHVLGLMFLVFDVEPGHVALELVDLLAALGVELHLPGVVGICVYHVAGPAAVDRTTAADVRNGEALEPDGVHFGIDRNTLGTRCLLLQVGHEAVAQFARRLARIFGFHHNRTAEGFVQCRSAADLLVVRENGRAVGVAVRLDLEATGIEDARDFRLRGRIDHDTLTGDLAGLVTPGETEHTRSA